MDSHLEKLQSALVEVVAAPWEMSQSLPGKWCVGEILEHLYLTYTGTAKGLERVIKEGKPMATTMTMRHRMRGIVVLWFGYLPEGRKAPERTVPKGLPAEQVRVEIFQKLAEMDAAISRCEGQFGANCKLMDHPVLGPLNGRQWRQFHLVHGLHHVKQIRRLQSAQK